MTLSLLLETCTEKGCVALLEKGRPLYHAPLPFGLHNSQSLMPAIQTGLKAIGKKCHDISFVSIGIGPGSYTGIRVGAIVGKTLAYALNIPLVCFSSLNSFIPAMEGKFSAAIDAKIGGVYLLAGNFCNGKVTYSGKPEILALPDAHAFLISECVRSIATPHAFSLRSKMLPFHPNDHWEWDDQAPNIDHLGGLAWDKFTRGDLADIDSVELLYLRKTQAEIEKET